jgi:hypothetical protein
MTDTDRSDGAGRDYGNHGRRRARTEPGGWLQNGSSFALRSRYCLAKRAFPTGSCNRHEV